MPPPVLVHSCLLFQFHILYLLPFALCQDICELLCVCLDSFFGLWPFSFMFFLIPRNSLKLPVSHIRSSLLHTLTDRQLILV